MLSDTILNPYSCPLTGRNLVEAGAGTGKTYNIQILVLRKLLQPQEVSLRNILVVTFTIDATAELRNRLRAILQEMKQRCQSGVFISDQTENFFRQNLLTADGLITDTQDKALQRVEQALQIFDEAPIYTIHSFCQRMLQINAFESGIRYGLEVRTDLQSLYQELLREFYREMLFLRDPNCAWYWKFFSLPEKNAFALINNMLLSLETSMVLSDEAKAYLAKVPQNAYPPTVEQIIQVLRLLAEEVDKQLTKMRDSGNYQRFRAVPNPEAGAALDFSHDHTWQLLSARRMYPFAEMQKAIKGQQEDLPYIQEIQELSRLANTYRDLFVFCAYQYLTVKVEEQKTQDNFLTYNDLLLKLRDALRKETDQRLLRAIQQRFVALFLDEFQDTDPVQFEIFNRIFGAPRFDGQENCFFMIGDPKQAIYSFRGGDIQAYLRAKKIPSTQLHTLTVNFRSSPSYIAALNNFYSQAQQQISEISPDDVEQDDRTQQIALSEHGAFGMREKIPWRIIENKPTASSTIRVAGQELPPEQLLLNISLEKISLQDVSVTLVSRLVQTGDVRLHSAGDTGLGRPIHYNDIAILVDTTANGTRIEAALQEAGIPVIWNGKSNIFASAEATQLAKLLAVILDPTDTRSLKQTLLQWPLDLTKEQIAVMDTALPALQQYFCQLRELWQNKNFLIMFRHFFSQSLPADNLGDSAVADFWPQELSVAEKIGSSNHGERKLTNLQHLAELLYQENRQRHSGPESLLNFLQNQCAAIRSGGGNDEDKSEQLRLPSEMDAVLIKTIHKSKGLEYPLVILPDLWRRSHSASMCRRFHDADDKRCLDIRNDQTELDKTIKAKCFNEDLQDSLRLFYVAITRAKFACFLLGDFPDSAGKNAELGKKSPSLYEYYASCLNLKIEPPECWQFPASTIPAIIDDSSAAPESTLAVQVFPERFSFRYGWQTCSFTSLAPGQQELTGVAAQSISKAAADTEMPDISWKDDEPSEDDERDSGMTEKTAAEFPELAPASPAIFRFASGKRTGIAWHSFFEELDFQIALKNLPAQVQVALDENALLGHNPEQRAEKLAAFTDMVTGVLQVPLDDEQNIRLAEISLRDRLPELRFTYNLPGGLNSQKFSADLRAEGVQLPADWTRTYQPGSNLTGAIDLLFRHNDKFYILDWKTNFIGGDWDNFSRPGLEQEMNHNCYKLQYILYTVAFFQYLKQRLLENRQDLHLSEEQLYEKYIGGVYYLFVRGISWEHYCQEKNSRRGIYQAKPSYALIKKLDEYLGCVDFAQGGPKNAL